MGERPALEKRVHAWYCKLSQKLIAEKVTSPSGEGTTDVLLNVYTHRLMLFSPGLEKFLFAESNG